jgi:hypothetical protein
MPISGLGSFCMEPLKGAVIKELGGVLYANPVSCVAVCSQHTPLPGPFLLFYSLDADVALMLAEMDLDQAEQHCTLYIFSAGCTAVQLIIILAIIFVNSNLIDRQTKYRRQCEHTLLCRVAQLNSTVSVH